MSGEREQLRHLLCERAYLQGEFRLSSGKASDHYFDAKQVTLDPEGAALVGKLFFRMIEPHQVRAIGGMTTGADPIAVAVAAYAWTLSLHLPAFVIRKEPKKHGLSKFIEGPLRPGSRVAVVDDVITSGQSVEQAIHVLVNEHACDVAVVAALVDRGEGGRERMERLGYEFKALFTAGEVTPSRSASHASP
ncbi:MAG TPA: orotate phosphoribosyltransferase [Gemmatimonadales bacterium]|nr:orotate phosphoribosyltransferase [Gemmatimonadales bacterium]